MLELPKGVTMDDVCAFTTGGCYELALELSGRVGWPTYMECWEAEEPGDAECCSWSQGRGEVGCHGYVLTPDGHKLDVLGLNWPSAVFVRNEDWGEEGPPQTWWPVDHDSMAYAATVCSGYVTRSRTIRVARVLLAHTRDAQGGR